MTHSRNECFQTGELRALLAEQTPEADESEMIQHLTECEACQQALERATARGSVWENLHPFLAPAATGLASDNLPDAAQFEHILDYFGPTDRPDMLGRIGGYEVCGFVGHGSTGVVVKALEPRLNRYVAIKILSPSLAHNGSARQRFAREGRAVAAVAHEHVVPIFAVDEFRGLPYIVMQFVSGGSLQQRIDTRGPLSAVEVVRIGRQVASGLAAAHAQGVVHRDVKPANVMLEAGVDRAIVSDFGMARVTDEASMTRSGVISGTPQFMSPEQAQGEHIDHRSDLFSLGSLMYAASTGRPPFRAQTVYGIIQRVCEAKVRPAREFNPEIPEWLQAFIEKLCSKSREDRFDSAEQVSELLSHELAHMQSPTAIARPPRDWIPRTAPNRWGQMGFALIVLLVAAIGVGFGQLAGDGRGNAQNGILQNTNQDSPVPDAALTRRIKPVVVNGRQRSIFENRFTRSFAAEPDQVFTLLADRGNIEVVANDTEEVTVVVIRRVLADDQASADDVLQQHKTEFTPSDKGLTVKSRVEHESEQRTDQVRSVQFRVTVPHRHHVALTTAGNADIKGVAGSVSATTKGGNVQVGSVGPLEIHTGGGNITAKTVNGSAELETLGGNIGVGEVAGDVSVTTSGGNISLGDVQGTVSASTGGGNIVAALSKQPTGDSDLSTLGGHVTIEIRKDLACELDANAMGGFVHAPFSRPNSKPGQSLRTTLNGGGPALKARSVGGHITIRYLKDQRPTRDSKKPLSERSSKHSGVLNNDLLQEAIHRIAAKDGVAEFVTSGVANHVTTQIHEGLDELMRALEAHDESTRTKVLLHAEDRVLEVVNGKVGLTDE